MPSEITVLTPMNLLQMAIEKEGSIDVIERLAKLQMEMIDREDRIAFRQAMTRFKEDMPKVIRSRSIKDKEGAEKYKAVALEDVAEPVMKALLRVGITYRWMSDMLPNGHIKVTCWLGLQGTAYEEHGATLAAPPDTSGGKDAVKAVGSTTAYLEKYTLVASIGMHVYGADPEAVTSRKLSPEEILSENTLLDMLAKIEESTTPEELKTNYFAAVKCAGKDEAAVKQFTAKKDAIWRKKGFKA